MFSHEENLSFQQRSLLVLGHRQEVVAQLVSPTPARKHQITEEVHVSAVSCKALVYRKAGK